MIQNQKTLLPTLFLLFFGLQTFAQTAEAESILARSITYHDPQGNWGSFNGSFLVELTTPGEDPRKSTIHMDQVESLFQLEMSQGDNTKVYALVGDLCELTFNGSTDFSEEIAKEHRLSCERARMYRDYYTYLYGLPMKLRDPGTQMTPVAEKRTFHGKSYWVIEVRYDPEVGKDLWYFYFNPETYAMEAYQFFHDKAENDGEYILLEGEHDLDGMRLPKVRTWYTNKADKLLGTDTLKNL